MTPEVPSRVAKKSLVWKYFSDVPNDNTHVICNVCDISVSRGGKNPKNFTTTNMKNHLMHKHIKEFNKYFPSSFVSSVGKRNRYVSEIDAASEMDGAEEKKLAGPSVAKQLKYEEFTTEIWAQDETTSSHPMLDKNNPRTEEMHRRIAEAIAINIHPISFVESLGLQHILRYCFPSYKIPSSRYITDTVIPGMFEKMLAKVKLEAYNAHYISLTTDIWSATEKNIPFLSITGHWLDENFKQHEAVLKVMSFNGLVKCDKIAQCLIKCLHDLDIPTYKVHIIIKDIAANLVNGLRDQGLEAMGCFLHTLQLCISETIFSQKLVFDILNICRNTIAHICNSALNESKFSKIQERLGIQQKLERDVTKRWTSTFKMLHSYYEQKEALDMYNCLKGKEKGLTNLTNVQWDIIKKLLELLSPFEEIVSQLCLKTMTMSCIIPTILTMKVILKNAEARLVCIKTSVLELKKSIIKRFDHLLTYRSCCLATFLDPRYKLIMQVEEVDKNKAFTWITEFLSEEDTMISAVLSDTDALSSEESIPDIHATALAPIEFKKCFEQLFNERSKFCEQSTLENISNECSTINVNCNLKISHNSISRKKRNKEKLESNLEAEVNEYLITPIMKNSSDPFSYWRRSQLTLPLLHTLALKYLSAPPISDESRRLFAKVENFLEPERRMLSPDDVEAMMFLHYNLKIYDFKYEDAT